MSIANNLVLSTETNLLTVPALTAYANVVLTLCNTTSSDEVVSIYACPAGAASADTNCILKSLTIPAYDTFVFESKLLLAATDEINAIGLLGSKVTATVSYLAI